jgi:hypothetical protein
MTRQGPRREIGAQRQMAFAANLLPGRQDALELCCFEIEARVAMRRPASRAALTLNASLGRRATDDMMAASSMRLSKS